MCMGEVNAAYTLLPFESFFLKEKNQDVVAVQGHAHGKGLLIFVA